MRARGVEELFALRANCAVEPCLGSCSCPKFLVQYLPSCLLHQFAYCLDSRRTRCDGLHKNTKTAED